MAPPLGTFQEIKQACMEDLHRTSEAFAAPGQPFHFREEWTPSVPFHHSKTASPSCKSSFLAAWPACLYRKVLFL